VPGLGKMAAAVGDLVTLQRLQLQAMELMTYRRGIRPTGPDLGLAGARLAIFEGEQAQRMLSELAGIEAPFMEWLEERRKATERAHEPGRRS